MVKSREYALSAKQKFNNMFKSIEAKFKEDILKKRKDLFGVSNILSCPKIEKVVINVRVKQGGNIEEEAILNMISKISGQKAIATKARLSISNFKIREGQIVGAKATLRNRMMIDFLDKLVNVTLPRVRDFSGLDKKAFDGKGNYTIGFSEYNSFPEVAGDDVSRLHGIEITIVTTADNNEQGFTLLKELGFPFKKK